MGPQWLAHAIRPVGWGPGGLAPATRTAAFQPPPVPLIPTDARQNRQNGWGMMNGHALPQNGGTNRSVAASRESTHRQRGGRVKYVANGNKASGVSSSSSSSDGNRSPDLSRVLAAAIPQQQKQILGERLYTHVHKHRPDLVAKITGMLLEMDNSELLLLLESPEQLAAKVEEAVQVLKLSKTRIPNQDGIHPSYVAAGVAVR
ncbi:hypothetical protein Nepgr_028154 [Nepenthes gracilis]|uniref:PABC domain-containing protein n=1 Tax=Nepenthes gracilis TaxID=150966 RepID=A0AAD3Y495_NEPGR|nr:hypothetical protein Nepgr_028154 [Nepenthes gracilis]